MPAKKSAGAEEPEDVLPRLCHLSRNDSSSRYGFTLKGDGVYVVKNVRDGLPAEVGGLREGDHILEVNGKSIDGIEHGRVLKMLGEGATRVDLLVVNNLNASLNHKNAGEKISGMLDVYFVI